MFLQAEILPWLFILLCIYPEISETIFSHCLALHSPITANILSIDFKASGPPAVRSGILSVFVMVWIFFIILFPFLIFEVFLHNPCPALPFLPLSPTLDRLPNPDSSPYLIFAVVCCCQCPPLLGCQFVCAFVPVFPVFLHFCFVDPFGFCVVFDSAMILILTCRL